MSEAIIKAFSDTFGTKPSFLVTAPGRINLIGEHTDYNGFPVLPISIPYSITAAGRPRRDATVRIANLNRLYTSHSFEIAYDIPRLQEGHWANYVKAAAHSLTHIYGDLKGMDILFHGTIPVSAGLSSSSALVIASALLILTANGLSIEPIDLAELMAEGERYVGTQGGGMDQAICLLGRKDHAVRIDFFPLRFSYVPFPAGYSVVVAHSLVRAAKTENALFLYNRRPAECRLATAIINAVYQLDPPINRLGNLPGKPQFLSVLREPAAFVLETFKRESYTLTDIAGITGETGDEIIDRYLMTRDGIPMPVPPEGFFIRQRAHHIFSEALRVDRSCNALNDNDIDSFGELMNESHESCDSLYGISTPELNLLVMIMRKNGASGARLTGAGFGGCAVALVRDGLIDRLIDRIRADYYGDYIQKRSPGLSETLADTGALFTVKPSDGASVRYLP